VGVGIGVGVKVGVGVGVGVGVKVGVGVSVGASAVWVAKVLAAIFVAWASTSAWDGPQATKMAPVNRHTRAKGTFFSTCRTSVFQKGRRISVNSLIGELFAPHDKIPSFMDLSVVFLLLQDHG